MSDAMICKHKSVPPWYVPWPEVYYGKPSPRLVTCRECGITFLQEAILIPPNSEIGLM